MQIICNRVQIPSMHDGRRRRGRPQASGLQSFNYKLKTYQGRPKIEPRDGFLTLWVVRSLLDGSEKLWIIDAEIFRE